MEAEEEQQPGGDVRSMLTQLRAENAAKKGENPAERNEEVAWERRRTGGADDSADENRTARKAVPSKTPNIDVVVRVRPLNEQEAQRRDGECFHYPGNGSVLIEKQTVKPFSFSVVFEPEATQYDLFEQSGVKQLLRAALQGYTCTCFAFGQTGAGKTHTLLGPDSLYEPPQSQPELHNLVVAEDGAYGIIPRSLAYLLEMAKPMTANEGASVRIQAHFVEIYNEHIRDLLLLNPRRHPQIRYQKDTGFFLENVFKVSCETLDDLMAVLEEGVRNRHIGSTHSNETSSRGHAVLTLEIDSETVMNDRSPTSENGTKSAQPQDEVLVHRHGKMTFVDLAGSEKIPGGASVLGNNEKDITHYLETNTINKSLLVLGNCISALSDPKRRNGYIPFRDSNLTKLLCDSLGGNGYTLMIACVTPSASSVSDSLNTLRYAQRAKNIRNRPKVRMDPREELFLTLRKEVKNLRQENYFLREQLNLPYRTRYELDDKGIQYSPRSTHEQPPYEAPRALPRPERTPELPLVHQYAPLPRPRPVGDLDALPLPRQLENFARRPLFAAQDFPPSRFADVYATPPPPPLPQAHRRAADLSLYEMLQEYMVENEVLRKEKLEMLRAHNRCERDQELLQKENDRIRRKFDVLQRSISRSLYDVNATPVMMDRMAYADRYAEDDYHQQYARRGRPYASMQLPQSTYDYGVPMHVPAPAMRGSNGMANEPEYDFGGANAIAFQKQPLPPQYVLKPSNQKRPPPQEMPTQHEALPRYAGDDPPPPPPPPGYMTPPQNSQTPPNSGPYADYMPGPKADESAQKEKADQEQTSVDAASVTSDSRKKPPHRVEPIQQASRDNTRVTNQSSSPKTQTPLVRFTQNNRQNNGAQREPAAQKGRKAVPTQ